jgi:uncharacterized protein (DUF58 family)
MAADFVALVARLLTVTATAPAPCSTPTGRSRRAARRAPARLHHRPDQKTGDAKARQSTAPRAARARAAGHQAPVGGLHLSDFISEPGWARLSQLGQRHEVLAVRLYDALELELPDAGLVIMEDAETGQQLFVDTHDAAFRRRFAALAAEREAALRAALSGAGADCIELSTEDDLADTLIRFARLRKRRAQLVSGGVPPALIR